MLTLATMDSPERDRWVARQVRHGPRRAQGVGDLVDAVLNREERNRMRRYGKAVAVLRAHLPAAVHARIRPVDLRGGVLTVAVKDSVLLSEMTQHHAAGLQQALVAAGTGISRVRFIVRR